MIPSFALQSKCHRPQKALCNPSVCIWAWGTSFWHCKMRYLQQDRLVPLFFSPSTSLLPAFTLALIFCQLGLASSVTMHLHGPIASYAFKDFACRQWHTLERTYMAHLTRTHNPPQNAAAVCQPPCAYGSESVCATLHGEGLSWLQGKSLLPYLYIQTLQRAVGGPIAHSTGGPLASSFMTWLQAYRAAAASNKRLLHSSRVCTHML